MAPFTTSFHPLKFSLLIKPVSLLTLLLLITLDSSLAKKTPPELPSPEVLGKKHIVIDLSSQQAYLFSKEETLLWKSEISSGREEKPTPTGTYTISHKHKDWTSTIYKVEMPHFLRFNSGDMGIHAGPLPGYPGSAGCIRLPEASAESLFTLVDIGTEVHIKGVAPSIEELKKAWKEKWQKKHSPFSRPSRRPGR